MNAIHLDRVTLERGGRIVLRELTASIRAGEFIGVFGPNGAGKTTLLQAVLGLLSPASGSIRVFGATPRRGNPDAGYLPQHRANVADLAIRARDFVAIARDGHRWGVPMPGRDAAADVDRVLDLVDAAPLAKRPLSQLSGGERQRLLLAQALLGKPRVLLLDEPLLSLDPRVQQEVVALIKRLQQALGVTVLFTAHDLNPLLGAMDRVLYLGHGRGALGAVEDVMRTDVLSALYGTQIDVMRIDGRIVVVSGEGALDADAHRHDA